jgi:Protein of unknown function (DUF3011)
MKKRIIVLALALTGAFAGPAFAAQVTCASTDGKYKECRLDGSGDIVMKQQLSKTNCTKDVNWGETANGVYVKGGCRAIFETMSMSQPQYSSGNNAGGSGYKDLVGAKAAGGEQALNSRGYDLAGTSNLPDAKVMYWWKPNGNGCIMVTVREGRYQAIRDIDRIECKNAQ